MSKPMESSDSEESEREEREDDDDQVSLDELLLREHLEERSVPAGYINDEIMETFVPVLQDTGKRMPFHGILWEKLDSGQRKPRFEGDYLSILLPSIIPYVKQEEERRLLREKREDQKTIYQEKVMKQKTLASKHLFQRGKDLKSAIGSFFQYVRLVEALDKGKEIHQIKLSVLMLTDQYRISGYIKFLHILFSKPRSRRNKTQALTRILKRFEESKVLRQHRSAEIKTCLKILRDSSNLQADHARTSVSVIFKESELINAGNFMERAEKIVFIKWLHKRIQAIMQEEILLDEQAYEFQNLFLTFIQPFFGGLRREVLAGLKLSQISVLESGALVLTPGVEKRFRSKDDKIPVPRILVPIFKFFVERARPLIVKMVKFNPKSLWIDKNGSAMEFNTFTNCCRYVGFRV